MRKTLVDGLTMFSIGEVVRLVVSIVLFGISVALFRRSRALTTSLLLVGSFAYAAKHVFWDFVGFLAPYRLLHPDSAFAQIFYPTDASAPWANDVVLALFFVSMLFPIGVLLYVITAVRKHLTKRCSQPLTGA
jgi:hypothetical protein